jgi:2-hydroxymuconate-semialdehyde hydrolase
MIPLEHRHLSVSGGEMAYVDEGVGPPVVLVHGFPTSSFLWRREAWLLAQRMRVIAPDLLGYGRSAVRPNADLSEPAQAGYVRELLDHLGVRELAIVGHDIGGAVAQMLALDDGLDVRAIALLDSACFDAWPVEGVKMLQAVTPEQQTAEFAEELVRLTFDLGMAHRDRLDEPDLRSYVEPWTRDPGDLFQAVRAISGKGLAGRDAELAALDTPVLIVWGEEDPFLGSELAERLGDVLPGSAVALLPGCSHFVTEDAPQTVGPLVYEYLRARYLSETHHHSGPVPLGLEER